MDVRTENAPNHPKPIRRSVRTLTAGGLTSALLACALVANSAFVASGLSGAAATNSTPSGTGGNATHRARVDLETPTFSDPTSITNPLFPRSDVGQVIQLGKEGGDTLRFEVTQLPDTKVIAWNGQRIETRVTHFVAYANGRILEVAVDFYAQADDGSVWYFGENVDNYEHGVIANHDGTWLAGKDGPPGMIMPADPQVGDVYRPENIPGFVFEEVTVISTGETVDGPRGPVSGAVSVRERLMDGTTEDKIFAPGYGEFRAQVVSLDELYHLALAVPIDALTGAVPGELSELSAGAADVFRAARSERWKQISATVDRMTSAWDTFRTSDVPRLLDAQMREALDSLGAAAAAREVADVRRAAIHVAQAGLDLQLRYRPTAEVDRDRLGLWRRQLMIDRAAGNPDAIAGDVATLRAIRDRIDH